MTLKVQLPDGTPAVGAQIDGTNTNAWTKDKRKWPGTTLQDGTHTWSNLDKGTLGNYYTFHVTYKDPHRDDWEGDIADRISGPTTLTVILHRV